MNDPTNTEPTPAGGSPLERQVTQHTRGPWACFYKHKYDEWHVSLPMSEGSMKWALFDDGVRSENPEADARLISAAPDLLAAVQRLLRAHYKSDGIEYSGDHPAAEARRAVAKALGDA